MTVPAAARKRGPGRPPDIVKRQAIIDAARAVLAEVGYASMTIDAVAQRAGSNRVLIYRVWDSKVVLARDALLGTADTLSVPDTGSTIADLEDWVRQLVRNMNWPAYLKGVPGLTVELLNDPELFRDTYERYIKPTEVGFATILDRGRARGEVVAAADPKLLTRVVSGTTTALAQSGLYTTEEITELIVGMLTGGIVRVT